MNKRNLLRVVGLLVLAVVAYTRFRAQMHPGEQAAALAAPIPADAQAFTLGRLHFTACQLPQLHSGATTSAFCAPFSVPESRAGPGPAQDLQPARDGRTLHLRLALIKSDAVAADRDLVVWLAGGPGGSAVNSWPEVAAALAPLRRHHHILLLDQRGTGQSHPLTCHGEKAGPQPQAQDRDRVDLSAVRKRVSQCLAEVEKDADPRFYTTTDAARDLEDVRQALGAPPLDLIGQSYGTRMAQEYALQYPHSVRSIVLDSVVPNQVALGEDWAENLDHALKLKFKRCRETPACQRAFGDPYASLMQLRDRLRAHPQDFSYRDPVTNEPTQMHLNEYVLAALVRFFAYSPETAALLPLSIDAALKGDYTPLAGQSRLLFEASDLTEVAQNAMQLSVLCSEDADLLRPRPQDAGLLLGTLLIDVNRAACQVWPHGTRPPDFHAPLSTPTPVLILEGEEDPVTPPRYGREVLQGLSNGRLLVAKGMGHGVIGRGCIPTVVGDFVDKLDPKTLDAACVEQLGPIPAFTDFNGSAP